MPDSSFHQSIELCGRLADLAGRELSVEIDAAGCTVAELKTIVAGHSPALAQAMANRRVRFCVNDQIVGEETTIRKGDRIAIFPPVSGG